MAARRDGCSTTVLFCFPSFLAAASRSLLTENPIKCRLEWFLLNENSSRNFATPNTAQQERTEGKVEGQRPRSLASVAAFEAVEEKAEDTAGRRTSPNQYDDVSPSRGDCDRTWPRTIRAMSPRATRRRAAPLLPWTTSSREPPPPRDDSRIPLSLEFHAHVNI